MMESILFVFITLLAITIIITGVSILTPEVTESEETILANEIAKT